MGGTRVPTVGENRRPECIEPPSISLNGEQDPQAKVRQRASMSAEAATIPVVSAVQPRRFGLNLVTNVGHLGLTMVVGVLYVPFLVTHLGPAVYGLVPLISMVTSYMALMTLGLNSAIGR